MTDHVHRCIGEPLAIDMKSMEKRKNGLIVGPKQMTNIVVKGSDGTTGYMLTLNIGQQ